MTFTHLHLHTSFSFLDSCMSPVQVANKVKSLDQPAVAITDHGNMCGVIQFWDACKKAGVQPIIGTEAYIAPGSRFFKEKQEDVPPYFHLTLLATDMTGLQNLYKLTTLSYTEGFYHKPRIDHQLLSQYNQGIICLSGCLAGKVASLLAAGVENVERQEEWIQLATEEAKCMYNIFGDRYYVELQRILPIQDQLIPLQTQIAKALGVNCVTTCDSHYVEQDDYTLQDHILCIGTGKLISDTDRMKAHPGLHIKSEQEMRELFKEYPQYVDCTQEITERCKPLSLCEPFKSKGYIFPVFTESHENDIDLFKEKCWHGLMWRGLDKNEKYVKQLQYEIDMIQQMGFCSYFLVVADYLQWAREHDIMVGPGRGSAAGSLAAYCLHITDIDPIKYKLYFERFLNPARKSMPDIDCDIDPQGRQAVFQYLHERYGADSVCQIATFSEFKPRGSIRDFGRVQGASFELLEAISALIPPSARGHDPTWKESLEASPSLNNPEFNSVVTMASKSEGLFRQRGIHAGGAVIGPCSLMNYIPLQTGKEDEIVSQWDMNELERVGLVKMDILGVSSLTLISKCLKLIQETTGIVIDISTIPLDDPKTYEIISAGETNGLFQLDAGGGIKDLCMRLRPKSIEDLSAIVSLYRPGPIDAGFLEEYVTRVSDPSKITYEIPELKPILDETYGVFIYQEQIMKLSMVLAGYTASDADTLRKVIGKKKREDMAKEETKFINGCLEHSIDETKAQNLFNDIKGFADYCFNAAHAVSYSFITYYTAYLKANYPLEFYCALLTLHTDERDKTMQYLNDCKRLDLQVAPPDVNESGIDFNVVKGTIRFGLAGIKGIAERAAGGIIKARQEGGLFKDLFDFYDRTQGCSVNKGTIEALAKAGALGCLNVPRAGILQALDDLVDHKKKLESYEKKIQTYQKRLIAHQEREALNADLIKEGKKPKQPLKLPELPVKPVRTEICVDQELELSELLKLEKEMLGLYITSHPLYEYAREMRQASTHTNSLVDHSAGEYISILGIISNIKPIVTKKGQDMCVILLEDLHGQVEVVVFNKLYEQIRHQLAEELVVFISGRVDAKGDAAKKILAQNIDILQPKKHVVRTQQKQPKAAKITFKSMPTLADIQTITTTIKSCPGQTKTSVYLQTDQLCFKLLQTASISSECIKQLQKLENIIIECS